MEMHKATSLPRPGLLRLTGLRVGPWFLAIKPKTDSLTLPRREITRIRRLLTQTNSRERPTSLAAELPIKAVDSLISRAGSPINSSRQAKDLVVSQIKAA